MATRSSWKGCLQLSLVCIPVKAYSTASSGGGEIHLNQLHADCHRRIQYKKTCPLHGEVSTDQIVSGYEYAQDHYVVVDPDELDRLRTEADKAIKIDVFIASEAFDPLYGTGKRYYLAPDGPAGQKAYTLLYQAMVQEHRYALAQVVLHGREQLVLLRPQENLLILEVLHYRHQVTQPSALAPLLDGAPVHLVNTDPPYGVNVEPRSNNAIASGLSSFKSTKHHQRFDVARHPKKAKPTHQKLRAKDRPLANDFLAEADFNRLLNAWFSNIARVLLPGRALYCWAGWSNLGNFPPLLKTHGLYFSQAIIWTKGHAVLTRKDFMGDFELAFYCWREGAAHQFFGPNNVTDVWAVHKVNPQNMIHLTEKPVELAGRAIQYSSRPGENVLDLFGGSGSTLIAAEQTGRRAFLMELDCLYCDVIVTRWEQFTGQKARRESNSSQRNGKGIRKGAGHGPRQEQRQ